MIRHLFLWIKLLGFLIKMQLTLHLIGATEVESIKTHLGRKAFKNGLMQDILSLRKELNAK